ncbi:MAG: galactose mutarotase [Runella slithyformis]|nr:MAG: galactose mutarotase [Runella slithyformis]TAF28335.1 MAG: galactose mutarotase [Runella slithyformis]TAF81935.1 MAG: galactose mutarotase [Runella slithyformis]
MLKYHSLAFIIAATLLLGGCNSPSSNQTDNQSTSDSMSSISSVVFGQLPDGQIVNLYTLRSKSGTEIKITNYGGIITHWTAPDNAGIFEDIVLGYDTLGGYLKDTPYFGAIVGRYGNRIAKGKFTIDEKTYELAINNAPNHLHGGKIGFDKAVWEAKTIDAENALQLSYVSKDGEEGFPGALTCTVLYKLTDEGALEITYTATTDKPTVVNLTNHTYFNLTGEAKNDILGHELTLNADRFLPVDAGLIPTGELRAVQGTPFDFTKSIKIGAGINNVQNEQIKLGGGYDHCWLINRPTQNTDSLVLAAIAHDPGSGRVLEAFTTEPALQFYTGNFLNGGITGKNNTKYEKRCAFCLETQHYPDSPNQPQFPSVVLRPGQTYRTKTVYKLSVKK